MWSLDSQLLPCLDGGGAKAVNADGGGGSRLKGPAGQAGQLNGMPSKKSQSTSKLSVKGEQGNYQTEPGGLALRAPGPGETAGDVIISLLLTDGEGEDCDWVAPHQNTVSHVDPHAPLAGLPPGEGNAPSLPPSLHSSFLSPRTSTLDTTAVGRLSVFLSPCVRSALLSGYWMLFLLHRNIHTSLHFRTCSNNCMIKIQQHSSVNFPGKIYLLESFPVVVVVYFLTLLPPASFIYGLFTRLNLH